MRTCILLVMCCFIVSCFSNDRDKQLSKNSGNKNEIIVNIDSILKDVDKQNQVNVTVPYDPTFKMQKTYQGIAFKNLLRTVLNHYKIEEKITDVVFVCKDGYYPVKSVDDILNGPESFLIYKYGNGNEKNWPDSLNEMYSPYYLVWVSDSASALNYPWPYGLTSLKFIENDSIIFSNTINQNIRNGYNSFRNHCFSCHSINETGGQVGPELNVPKNITEYWTDENIKRYIIEPKSFRSNAKMPDNKNLNNDEIDAIIEYLHFIAKHKTR